MKNVELMELLSGVEDEDWESATKALEIRRRGEQEKARELLHIPPLHQCGPRSKDEGSSLAVRVVEGRVG